MTTEALKLKRIVHVARSGSFPAPVDLSFGSENN